MASPKRIDISKYGSAGITIEYVKSRDVFYISGWYDSIVGIGGEEISRAEFEERLGVPASPPRAPSEPTGKGND